MCNNKHSGLVLIMLVVDIAHCENKQKINLSACFHNTVCSSLICSMQAGVDGQPALPCSACFPPLPFLSHNRSLSFCLILPCHSVSFSCPPCITVSILVPPSFPCFSLSVSYLVVSVCCRQTGVCLRLPVVK